MTIIFILIKLSFLHLSKIFPYCNLTDSFLTNPFLFQCVESECNFVELDVRTTKDGQLILLHDEGLERLTWSSEIKDVRQTDWDSIKNIDVGVLHVNR